MGEMADYIINGDDCESCGIPIGDPGPGHPRKCSECADNERLRVAEYECTVYYRSTGSSHTKQYPFTQAQADEAGAELGPEGLPLRVAARLCAKWTRRGNHKDIRYTYRVST